MLFPLYRFRPAGAVLDKYEELARQEIYFSPPEELNDPMEGYKDVFWLGDRIIWRNLLRHYLLCLLKTTALCVMAGASFAPHRPYANTIFSIPEPPQAAARPSE